MKCPESMEDLEALEQLLPLCRTELLEQAQARLEAGTATSERDAAKQLADETGRTTEGIRSSLKRAKKEVGSVNPDEQKWSGGRHEVYEKNQALVEGYKDEHLIQRYKDVCEIMGLELPDDLDEVVKRGSWQIKNYITEVMREINRTTGHSEQLFLRT